MANLKTKALRGVIWSATERFSAQGVQFILGLILARLLSPSDYGLIGMLFIFMEISETFIQSGFSIALVQKKGRDDLDYSTTFYFNLVVGLLFYFILFISAPLIADFYDQPLLIPLTRAFGISIIINALGVVQRAKFTIDVDFKTQTKASLSAIIISGLVGITLAYKGYGVWALVYQTLIRRTIDILILWFISNWIPQKSFSIERFKSLFSFGYKLLLSGLIDTIFRNVYIIVIGKVFSAASLGYYTRAQQFGQFPSINITNILGRVTFPILSELQDDDKKLKESYQRIIKLTALLIFPLMVGLAVLADPLIVTILTEKWRESVWMLQILCFSMMWYPIHSINLSLLNVKGRSDLFLKLEIIKKLIISISIIVSIPFGIKALIMTKLFTTLTALIINLFFTKKIINYGFWDQMKDLIPIFLISLLMGVLVHFVILNIPENLLKLIIGTLSGIIFFLSAAWFFNIGDIKSIPLLIRTT